MRAVKDNSTSPQSNGLEERLRAERHSIIQSLVAESTPNDYLREGWQELGSPVEDELRDLEYSHRDALRRRLRETDEAIGRLKAGTYGRCAVCGERINRKRLAADPAAALCLTCQAAAEGETSIPKM